jgi:hypothetical protein
MINSPIKICIFFSALEISENLEPQSLYCMDKMTVVKTELPPSDGMRDGTLVLCFFTVSSLWLVQLYRRHSCVRLQWQEMRIYSACKSLTLHLKPGKDPYNMIQAEEAHFSFI